MNALDRYVMKDGTEANRRIRFNNPDDEILVLEQIRRKYPNAKPEIIKNDPYYGNLAFWRAR